jgi:hypothetical protein
MIARFTANNALTITYKVGSKNAHINYISGKKDKKSVKNHDEFVALIERLNNLSSFM